MATSNSSIEQDQLELTSPGKRTGEGSGSVIPYLQESLATRPGALSSDDHYPEHKPGKSLARRVRVALLNFGIKKRKKRPAGR